VDRVRSYVDVPLILKGISTAEDAEIAVARGVDCIYVSNHGGRQLDHSIGSVAALPEKYRFSVYWNVRGSYVWKWSPMSALIPCSASP